MRKMNCRILAAALVAVQIAVTAMPATALAAETDQVQEMVQEQAEETAPVEGTPAVVAEAPAKEEEAAPAETEASVEEPEEAVETETQNESAVEVTEELEETRTQETEKTTETAAVTENKEETKASEKPAEGKSFDQTATVDRVKVRMTAEEGAFEEGAKLSVVRVPSTQLKEVENAVADARAKDELVKSAYAFDVKVVGKDGSSLQPTAGRKVKVSFETEEAADGSLGAVVYHIVGPKNNIKAQKLATTVNRTTKTAEAQTDGLSYYVVEFVSKSSADTNTDANVPAKTETTDDTDKTAKTETTEDTKTTGKTDPVPEAAVKKETRTDNKKSEVKKEKKSENKKEETAKKEKKDSKKTEKAKTNTSKSPKTGDTGNMVIWITTSLLAVGGIVVLLLFRRRLR